MTYLYHVIFKYPILNTLIFFYQTIAFHDLGIAIIEITLLIRIILYPLFHKSTKHQMIMQRLQPKIKKIQEVHKEDKQKQSQALMDLYKEHNVNPFLSIILLIVQLPILIALYRIILGGLGTGALVGLYPFVTAPASINYAFLGIINLQAKNLILVFCAAVAQYFQARLAIWRDPKDTSPLSAPEKMARQMAFIGPVVTIAIFYGLPAAVGLYWTASSLFSIIQQLIVNRHVRRQFSDQPQA